MNEVEAGRPLQCDSSSTTYFSEKKTVSSTVVSSPNFTPNTVRHGALVDTLQTYSYEAQSRSAIVFCRSNSRQKIDFQDTVEAQLKCK